MERFQFYLKSLQDTENFGRQLGQYALPGDVICLDGDLGAGKTALAQAIARGLQVPADCYVTSPSFAIMHEYSGRLTLYHMDFYRLQDSAEVVDLGFDEYFYMAGVTVIEWPNRAADILPLERLSIQIQRNSDESRTLSLESGPQYSHRLLAVVKEFEGKL